MSAPASIPVRDAATVVLLRDGADGIEAWLLTRVTQMVFAGGMSVFPGGRVEPADASLPFAGDGVAVVAGRFGCDEATARALLGAAVRETFEETGILLTVPGADLPDVHAEVEAGTRTFADVLREHGLVVDSTALVPWAHWVTPVGEVRRYDTRFFVGALPPGAQARDVTSESSIAAWVPVGEALEQTERGERLLLPPTLLTLRDLQAFDTVHDAVAGAPARSVAPIEAVLEVRPDGRVLTHHPDGSTFEIPRSMLL